MPHLPHKAGKLPYIIVGMNKWLRDVIVIPLVMSLAMGLLYMLLGAWYSGVPWHSPFSPHWLKSVGTSPVPFWYTLLLVFIVVIVGARNFTWSKKLKEANNANRTLEMRLDSSVRAHDEHLFLQADAVLSEQLLSDFLYRLQGDDSCISSQRFQLDQFAHFFSVTGNRFIDPSLLASVDDLRLAMNKLLAFIGQHFFIYPGTT
jgi:hypothetical protein